MSGAGPSAAWTPHRTERIFVNVSACGMAAPTAPGVLGGHPGVTNWLHLRRADGEERDIGPKEKELALEPGDVYEGRPSGGAGVEDPLLRDPALVAIDVRDGYASAATVRAFHGVVLDAGVPDEAETVRLRSAMRGERLGRPAAAECTFPALEGEVLRIGDVLAVVEEEDGLRFACVACGTDGGPASEDFKATAVRRDLPLEEAGPLFGDPARFVDAEFELRQYVCPACATLWETEVAAAEDPPLRSLALELSPDRIAAERGAAA